MTIDFTLPPPAIIEFQDVQEVRFGLSYAPSRTALDLFIAPRDWRDATIDELRAYIPVDLRDMPDWAIRSMFPLIGRGGGSKSEIKTTVFLTSMSASNQTWTVLSDWNSSDNIVHVIGGGGSGAGVAGRFLAGASAGRGGGGGGYSSKSNISLTPDGSATFRLGNRASISTGNGGAGSDVWFNGADLASSSVGAKGGGGATSSTNGSGGAAASGVGDVRYSGGNGSNGSGGSGPGGGAAGPAGNGGNATTTLAGAGGNGQGGAGGVANSNGGAGTEFQSSPPYGSGGGGGRRTSPDPYASIPGMGGGPYGGGGSGGYNLASSNVIIPAANGGSGAQGLIVIINNHLKGV